MEPSINVPPRGRATDGLSPHSPAIPEEGPGFNTVEELTGPTPRHPPGDESIFPVFENQPRPRVAHSLIFQPKKNSMARDDSTSLKGVDDVFQSGPLTGVVPRSTNEFAAQSAAFRDPSRSSGPRPQAYQSAIFPQPNRPLPTSRRVPKALARNPSLPRRAIPVAEGDGEFAFPAVSRSGLVNKSVIFCMDPTCNSCPPEMHAYRNRKLMEQLASTEDGDEYEGDGNKDSKDREKEVKAIQDAEAKLQGELDAMDEGDEDAREGAGGGDTDEVEEGGPMKNVEKARRRTVIRILGLRIVISRGRQRQRWTAGWVKWFRTWAALFTSVYNPHSEALQDWNRTMAGMGILGLLVDPLYYFILGTTINRGYLCLTLNWTLAIVLTVLSCVVRLWFLLHILLKFQTAYVSPPPKEWRNRVIKDPSGVPPGDLVFDRRHIAWHYVTRPSFYLDILSALPISQVILLALVPSQLGSSSSDVRVVLFGLLSLLQIVPSAFRLYFKFLASEHSQNMFESAWVSFGLNLSMYFSAAHVVGCIWFLFCVERVAVCLHQQCQALGPCDPSILYCAHSSHTPYQDTPLVQQWTAQTANATSACFVPSTPFGIFQNGVDLVPLSLGFWSRYLSALYWGFQQVSTIAGNQVPSTWVPEIIFILCVSALGLLLLALLIGNMSNFLQALSRRPFEYQMNRRDVQKWMARRNIPQRLQKKVNDLLRLQWATTRGVSDEEVLDLLTEDLKRDMRRRLCIELLTVSPLFNAMHAQVLDAFCERLQHRIYIAGTVIAKEGYPVSRLFFVLRGEVVRSSTRTGYVDEDSMRQGDFLGEEVLIQFLEKYATRGKILAARRGHGSFRRGLARMITVSKAAHEDTEVLPTSQYTAICIGPVEGYCLEAADVEAVCRQYAVQLLDEKMQHALNQCSRARRVHFARTIQLAWRTYLRKKYGLSFKECVEAARNRRFGHLLRVSDKSSGIEVVKELSASRNGPGPQEEDRTSASDRAGAPNMGRRVRIAPHTTEIP